jgi:hypothetical protein
MVPVDQRGAGLLIIHELAAYAISIPSTLHICARYVVGVVWGS